MGGGERDFVQGEVGERKRGMLLVFKEERNEEEAEKESRIVCFV
jgi:hypothetical protein